MLSAEENELITSTGSDTAAGQLLRHYWQPAALVDELQGERPAKAVKLMGEDLVVFRDDQGRYGLIGRQCPHRGADLCYGRLEDGGVRCPFHGWLFDVYGKCLEQPAEPEDSVFHTRIQHKAYPCKEHNGIVFAYLGPKDDNNIPELPNFDCFAAPHEYTFAFKGFMECNWLQALEVGIDPAHASFLHRFYEDEDPADSYGQQFRDQAADSNMPLTRILREYPRPEIKVEDTEYGMRLTSLRKLNEINTHVRITNMMFPNAIVIPMSNTMTITQWHVPVDDTRSYWYAIFTSFDQPVDKDLMRKQRLELYELPEYMPKINRSNDYGYDPQQQKTQTFTGMGFDINVHDQWAVESPGPIQDRTQEHLGMSDIGIRRNRKLLRKAIDKIVANERPPMMFTQAEANEIDGPVAVDAISRSPDWESCWREQDKTRRKKCDWVRTD